MQKERRCRTESVGIIQSHTELCTAQRQKQSVSDAQTAYLGFARQQQAEGKEEASSQGRESRPSGMDQVAAAAAGNARGSGICECDVQERVDYRCSGRRRAGAVSRNARYR